MAFPYDDNWNWNTTATLGTFQASNTTANYWPTGNWVQVTTPIAPLPTDPAWRRNRARAAILATRTPVRARSLPLPAVKHASRLERPRRAPVGGPIGWVRRGGSRPLRGLG